MPKVEALSICLINPRSCNNKTALLKQFINDLDLVICAITEVWPKEGDNMGKAALNPKGMKYFLHHTHQDQLEELQSSTRKIYKLLSHMNTSLGPVNVQISKLVLISVHTHWVCSTDQKITHS